MNYFNLLLSWSPAALWMAIIFTLSSFQGAQTTATYLPDFIFKKTIHVIEYGILWWLIFRASSQTFSKQSLVKNGFLSLLITIIYAATDELHQTFTPSREGTIRDVLIDTFGASLTFLAYYKLFTKNTSSR